MKLILLFTTLFMTAVWCDNINNLNEMPFQSPILTAYPCNDFKDLVIWFEPGLPVKERNQYYLYTNRMFPAQAKIETKFNAGVDIFFHVRTAENKHSRQPLKQGVPTVYRFTTKNPGLWSYGYKVKGTEPGKIPYLTSFKVNDVEYCNQPNRGYLDEYASSNIDAGSPLNCGRRKIEHTELIYNGAPTKPGDWPWHAAIYKFDNMAIKYICGGSLLSKHIILTAAHCASIRGVPMLPEILSVVLGKYNLFGGDTGSQEREVHRIIIHDQFQYRYLHNDIALLKLKTDVVLTDYIQPACLWYSSANDKLLTDEILGTVVGWGFDSSDTLSRTIRQAQMPMVADDVCMHSNPNFFSSLLNSNKFCAGYRNRTSACNGDSGGGFQVFIADEVKDGKTSRTGTWLIRGIVSLTISRADAPICDPEQYVVFTDVDKYLTWIQGYLDDDDE